MKKTMKWVFGLILTLVMPCALMAESVTLGVNINNVPVIDVVTTLSADIEIDVTKQVAKDAYVTITNKGTNNIAVSIVDIEPIVDGLPSEFIEYNRKENPLQNANEAETATKIAFAASVDGLNWQTIYPESENKPIELGNIRGSQFVQSTGNEYDPDAQYVPITVGATDNYHELFYNGTNVDLTKTFAVAVETGWNWTMEQRLEYAITLVVENDPTMIDGDYVPGLFGEGSMGVPYVDYSIWGDYALTEDGQNITNTLEGLAFGVEFQGPLSTADEIYAHYNENYTSTTFQGESIAIEDVHTIINPEDAISFIKIGVPNEYILGKSHPIIFIAYDCDVKTETGGCTEVARWGHIYYVPEV